MCGSHQYDKAFDVQSEIEHYIKTIRQECIGHASLGTKMNGLETLRKIGKTIALSQGDVIAHEVKKGFQGASCLDEAITKIVESMNGEEGEELRWSGEVEGEWFDKLVELNELGENYGIFDGLGDVVSLIGEYEEDEEGEDDEDGEEEEKGER